MSRVSVALCSCNRARLIGASLEAIAAQTRRPDELVIGDDRSDDGTLEVIEAFARRAPFPVRVQVNEVRLGLAGNYDRTIGRTVGDVVALCDDDDVWLPDKLERQLEALSGPNDPLLAFTDAELVDERLVPLGKRFFALESFAADSPAAALFATQLRTCVATTSTIAFRAELKTLALPIPEVWKPDWWLSSLAAASARAVWIDRPLIKYRQHAGAKRGAKRRGPLDQWRQGRSDNAQEYRIQRAQARALRARLTEHGTLSAGHPLLGLLDQRLEHLGRRIEMREHGRIRRALMVARELSDGQYHRYSLGLRSALKDAVF